MVFPILHTVVKCKTMHLPKEFEFKFCSFVGIIHVFYPCPAMSVHLWANLMKFYLIHLPHPPAVLEPTE